MIIDLQRRLAEVGRIRIGQQVTSSNGKSRPTKLETFRLTSADRARIANAATMFGGTPTKWQAPAGQQYEVITEVDHLNVVVPPSDMAFTQWYELWSAGGCQRRCDGQQATYNQDNTMVEGECLCDPDNRECQIHTRLSVMIRDLPGLGIWRLDTQGYYAAVELQGAVEVINLAAGQGQMLPAVLRLEQRMVKRPGQGTRRFAVPVLDIEVSPAQLLMGTVSAGLPADKSAPQARDTAPPALTPVPDTGQDQIGSIAEQALTPPKPRRRTAPPIPATGVAPRTAAQAATAVQPEAPMESDQATMTFHMPEPEEPATRAQHAKLQAILRELNTTEKADQLTIISHILRYDFTSSRSLLTKTEANTIIDTLTQWQTSTEYPAADRINDILNQAALDAEQNDTDDDE